MYRRIGRLIQIGIFAALPGGIAFAQAANSNQAVPNTARPDTDDTRTPVQKKAGKIDEQTPSVPGDTTRPGELPSPPRDINQGTPGATTDTKSDTKSTDSTSTTTKKSTGDTGDNDTTMEKKTTTKHKHIRKSSQSAAPNDFENVTPKADQKSKFDNLNPSPDDSLNHRLDSKSGDLDHKDQLNSDK